MFNISKYNKIIEEIAVLREKTQIIAISKNHSQDSVEEAIKHGVRIFGENRVQEAKLKFNNLKQKYSNIELHLTGPLQTNKVKEAISLFDVFHTLDREKLAREFIKFKNIENKKFFIQVNTGKEENKSGVFLEHLKEFVNYCTNDLCLNIVGLMCIPPINEDPKKHFSILVNEAHKYNLNQLSMGMSSDYVEAIKHSATYIRIGTALFGKRSQ
ncbi:YggS family pyridoxal phosphate-dependent enzyme [Pelagibacterales bacterium SAG-MED31]|nr:YggS family pyridoxal phosphate-dependent enzyme [Pelagibacterales bacterium SAG-MED31]